MALTERQKRFAFEYAKDCDATSAAIRSGYSERSAAQIGCGLIKNPEIMDAVGSHQETVAMVAQLSPAWVLRQWMEIATADPADLVRVERVACKRCWDCAPAPEIRLTLESQPNEHCTHCMGAGSPFVFVSETRKLKGSARKLYAGAVQTKDGIKILMRDQGEALKNIAAYLGMNKNELTGPGGGPIQLQAIMNAKDPRDMTLDELRALKAQKLLEMSQKGVDLGVSGPVIEGKTLESE